VQDDVLTTRAMPRSTPLPDGYAVRQFGDSDWELSVARAVAENARSGDEDPQSYEQFVRRQTEARRALSERGLAAFYGAFADGRLVAELGIVRCGTTARYQHVGTDEEHRRRGLASHLLGVAARWAGDQGCDQWVIVTEATNPAGRVYRAAGFELGAGSVEAYRNRSA
jgi:GNAT superfamily N-acetyltransferase